MQIGRKISANPVKGIGTGQVKAAAQKQRLLRDATKYYEQAAIYYDSFFGTIVARAVKSALLPPVPQDRRNACPSSPTQTRLPCYLAAALASKYGSMEGPEQLPARDFHKMQKRGLNFASSDQLWPKR